MQPVNHLSELTLDEWASEELSADERERVAEHVLACERCRARHEALVEQRAAFLAAAPSFEAHATRFVRTREPQRSRPRQTLLLAATSAVAMAAAALIVVWNGEPRAHTRTKGSPHIGWFVKRDELVYRGRPDELLHPRDSLRFTYSSDEPRYFALFDLDARAATVYYPAAADAIRLPAGDDLALDFSVELDEQLGTERVYALFCEESFRVEPLRAALLELGRLPERPGCQVDLVTLHKAPP